MAKSWRTLFVLLLCLALVAAGCGNDDDNDASPPAGQVPTGEANPTAEATAMATEQAPATEPEPTEMATESPEPEPTAMADTPAEPADPNIIELGGGAAINLADCPAEWENNTGLTDSQIRFGISLPQSGPAGGFGTIAEGMSLYFSDQEPIDGREVVIDARDDGYVPARTKVNVEEMIDAANLLGFVGILGSPNNKAVHEELNDNCIPQLLNLTGLPQWGDPNNFPWTSGGLMSYETEAFVWCQHIADEFGEGATAAVLALGNDAGEAWLGGFQDCAGDYGIEVVDEQSHDPQADGVGSNITTLAASGADVLVIASTGAFCPQSVAAAAVLEWDPLILVANGCQSIALFWNPIGPLANGIRMINTQKDVSDSSLADDEWVQWVRGSLEGAGVDPEAASHALGYGFAEILHEVLLAANEMDGGINRTNVMQAMWQVDFEAQGAIGNSLRKMDGATDSYLVEAGRMEELVVDADGARYVPVSELINLEGETGTFGG